MSAESTPQTQPLPALPPDLELVLQRFRLRARKRAAWLEELWTREGQGAPGTTVTRAMFTSAVESLDSLAAEQTWCEASAEAKRLTRELHRAENALRRDKTSRFSRLVRIFGLGEQERDTLEAAIALALDPALDRVCAYLNDHSGRAYLTEELAGRLYGHALGVPADSTIWRWELAHRETMPNAEPAAVSLDRSLKDWLLERGGVDERLAGAAWIQPVPEPLPDWPVHQVSARLAPLVRTDSPGVVRVVLAGRPGSGRKSFAGAVAAQLGLPLLVVDVDALEEREWPRAALRAHRYAFLERCALLFAGDSLTARRWARPPVQFPLQFVAVRHFRDIADDPGALELRMGMKPLTTEQQATLWRRLVPASRKWDEKEMRRLCARRGVSAGDVASAARQQVQTVRAAAAGLRRASRHRFRALAERLSCPFRWNDLVVEGHVREALDDFVFEARNRTAWWEGSEARRLFPQGQGLLGLFSGPPGTGKTMAAQVIAGALGMDLFRIDLSQVVSKWVGEFTKNVDEVISAAAETDVILFLDECDAVLAKRAQDVRDAQDRYVNMDTAHLLQSIESFDGVALLATNQKASIDPAFVRRIRYVVNFPKPAQRERLELWRKLVAGLAGADRAEALGSALQTLAAQVEATGAQIKNAVLGAVFAANRDKRPLGIEHLVRGLERELEKESRGFSPGEKARLLASGG